MDSAAGGRGSTVPPGWSASRKNRRARCCARLRVCSPYPANSSVRRKLITRHRTVNKWMELFFVRSCTASRSAQVGGARRIGLRATNAARAIRAAGLQPALRMDFFVVDPEPYDATRSTRARARDAGDRNISTLIFFSGARSRQAFFCAAHAELRKAWRLDRREFGYCRWFRSLVQRRRRAPGEAFSTQSASSSISAA